MTAVLSLFDGMSCGRVAMERAGITISQYHACEIDKYAIDVSHRNYPDIQRHGSVVGYQPDRWFDYIIAGSPCQGFSFAGDQAGFNDPRSALFWEFVRILAQCKIINPGIKFMLENVRMKKEWLDLISAILGVQPICINSALVSAQNRVRYYWCNWTVEQPVDRGIFLKDITEDGEVDRDKSYCIDANYYKGGSLKNYLNKARRKNNLTPGKSIALNQSSRRLMVKQYPRGDNPGFTKEMDKCPTVTANRWEQNITVSEDNISYRKLTPIECERLQTLRDNYTEGVSATQRYKMLGNGWTVDVIAHILEANK